jgi:hypothetical protein
MVRSYVVTFGFVTFRFLADVYPAGRWQPADAAPITYIWMCCAVPLLFTEVLLQLRAIRRA